MEISKLGLAAPNVYESVAAGGREERGLKEGDEDEDDGRGGHRPRGGVRGLRGQR